VQFALNQMTVPNLAFADFVVLARRLGCIGIEARNDLERPLFGGMDAVQVGKLITDNGLRLVGLSQVYPFNAWDAERETAVRDLIATATAAGAETISLIPRNDGTQAGDVQTALTAILPMLQDAGMTALIEPLGFGRSSLRSKAELIAAIGGETHFKIVHDTFHHALAGGGPIFPQQTGIVHISGVTDPDLTVDQMEDEHRVLVDQNDRLGNISQLRDLMAAGYDGPVSFECFARQIHALADPYTAIKQSIDFITSELRRDAA